MKTKFRVLQTPQLASDQSLHPILAHVPSPATSTYAEEGDTAHPTRSKLGQPGSFCPLSDRHGSRSAVAIEHWYHPMCSPQEGEEEGRKRGGEDRRGEARAGAKRLVTASAWCPF